MSETVIKVSGLGKKYRIGKKEVRADTFFGAVVNSLRAPFDNYRAIRGMARMNKEEDTIFWALRDVSFEVKEGEVLGVIGNNGAGKSTLLKILSQITEPSEGEAVIHGRVSSLLEVGTGFHQDLSGRENIYMNGTILGMTKKEIDSKLEEIIDFSGIEKYIDTPVKFYSSGMKVRLGFAVAAHLEPEILIIDEVLAVGDAEFQKKCLGKMDDVARGGRTVLFVSHNLEAVKSLCRTAIMLEKGRLMFSGNVDSVVNDYLSRHSDNQVSQQFDLNNAPGTEDVKLLSAALKSEEGEVLSIESSLTVEFRFRILKDIPEFNLSLVLWNVSGICIFNVVTPVASLKAGDHQSILTIPANLLNNHTYSIELYFVSRAIVLFKIPGLLVFELKDSGRKEQWFGRWIGAIRPRLDFTLN